MRLTATASWSAADEASHACSYDRVGAIGQHLICGRPARYIALAACLRIIAGMLSRVLGAALHSYESLVQRAALTYAQRWHSRLASEAWTGTTARKRLKKARLCAIRNSMTFTQNYGMRCCLKTSSCSGCRTSQNIDLFQAPGRHRKAMVQCFSGISGQAKTVFDDARVMVVTGRALVSLRAAVV